MMSFEAGRPEARAMRLMTSLWVELSRCWLRNTATPRSETVFVCWWEAIGILFDGLATYWLWPDRGIAHQRWGI